MKKINYISPETKVVKVEISSHLLDNSINQDGRATFNSSNMENGDGSDAGSRRGGWDD